MASIQENPFTSYPQSDINFLAAMNDLITRPITPEEKAGAREIFRGFRQLETLKETRRYEDLLHKIKERGVEARAMRKDKEDKLFVLTAEPIDLLVIQKLRRTSILFLGDRLMRYDPYFFYELFLVDLPKSIYGDGKDMPSTEHIRNSTIVSVATKYDYTSKYNLNTPSSRKQFEDVMDSPERIKTVRFVCDGEGVSFSLSLPNPESNDKYVEFSFPSNKTIVPQTLDLLLGIHKNGKKISPANKSFAVAFADSINYIREELRVR